MTIQEKYGFTDSEIIKWFNQCLEKQEVDDDANAFQYEGDKITLECGFRFTENKTYISLYECYCDEELNKSDELTNHIYQLTKNYEHLYSNMLK